MAQRPHDPFSPFDAVDDEAAPAKKTTPSRRGKSTTRRAKPTPTSTQAAGREQMVVKPSAVKAATKRPTAKTTPAKKASAKKASAKKTTAKKASRKKA